MYWMDTAMHDMDSLGRTLQIDLPRDWASLALHRDVWIILSNGDKHHRDVWIILSTGDKQHQIT